MPEEKIRRRRPYLAGVRELAIRLVVDHLEEYPTQWVAIGSVSVKPSINRETLRLWIRRANPAAASPRPATTRPTVDAIPRLA